jgi:uncharacterized protein YbjT (DUF2867 family)
LHGAVNVNGEIALKQPTIVVTNGTATEGYWSAYYLLKTARFNVRATVRRTDSVAAQRLKGLEIGGRRCEIALAANEDEGALRAAFDGADGIYASTIYNIYAKKYRHDNPEEMAQGRALIAAAKACTTLRHFVWQTMTRFDREPESLGLETPIHFRTKWQLEGLIKQADLPWTMLRQPAYMRQIKFGMQWKNRLVYPYPHDARLAYVAEQDIGKFVAAIFSGADGHLHQTINGVSEVLSPVELARRAHELFPAFSPKYRQATALENAFFDHVVVRLKPAFRYPSQINQNLKAGNYFAMTDVDKEACRQLISPLRLTTLEEWLQAALARP